MRRASSASKAALSMPGVRASTKSPGIGTTFDRPTLPPSTDHSDCVGAAVGMSNARPFLRLGKDQGPPQLIDRDRPLHESAMWTCSGAKPAPTTCGQPGYDGGNSKDPIMEMPMINSALPTR